MAFRSDTSKKQENSTIKPEGDYEVMIDRWTRRVTPNGAMSISFTYVIRNDVEQGYKNGLIFHDIWKKKEPTPDDLTAEGYNYNRLMAIADAAGLPANEDYDSFDAFLNALVGKPVKVHLYHDPYNGKTYEKIDKHFRTNFPEVKHKPKNKPAAANTASTTSAAAVAANSMPTPTASDDTYPF